MSTCKIHYMTLKKLNDENRISCDFLIAMQYLHTGIICTRKNNIILICCRHTELSKNNIMTKNKIKGYPYVI